MVYQTYFYILSAEDWKKIVQEYIDDRSVRIQNNVPVWKDGWKGINVTAEQVSEHRERWDKIESLLH